MNSIKILIAVFIAWFACSTYYENQLTTYLNEQLQAVNQQLIRVRDEERRQRRRANVAIENLSKAKHDLNLRYAELSNLRLQSDNSDDSMPRASNSSRVASRSTCQCAKQNREKLQRLYEQQLTIARDCDITATKYNELLQLVR